MLKTILTASAALALIATAPIAAEAKSIKAQMSGSQLASYCASAGVGTTTTTTINAAGKTVTGTVHCTAKDMKTASAADTGESETGPSEAAENGKED